MTSITSTEGHVEEGYITYTVTVGVDVGQKRDHTAIAVAEVRRVEDRPAFFVRHLERLELGEDWKAMATRVARVVEGSYDRLFEARERESWRRQSRAIRDFDGRFTRPPVPEIFVRVDATGLGAPVIEMIEDAIPRRVAHAVRIQPCFFTHGDKITKHGKEFSVGKAALVARMQSLMHLKALKIAKGTLDAEAMLEELLGFEIRIDERANDRYGAFRVGSHDDLVTALGLAVIKVPRGGRKPLTGYYNLPPTNPEHDLL